MVTRIRTFNTEHEFSIQALGLFDTKMVVFNAIRRTIREEAHFDISIYNQPDDDEQDVPSARFVFSEMSVPALLALLQRKKDININADGKRLTYNAASNKIAIYDDARMKKPSAFVYMAREMVQTLNEPHNKRGFFRALGIARPVLAS